MIGAAQQLLTHTAPQAVSTHQQVAICRCEHHTACTQHQTRFVHWNERDFADVPGLKIENWSL